MKRLIFHSVSVGVGLYWLITEHHTYNPFSLKGPDFLEFYLILLVIFYGTVFMLKFSKESISKATFFFMILILITGIIKWIKGVMLGKPIGYLTIILIGEIGIMMFLRSVKINSKII